MGCGRPARGKSTDMPPIKPVLAGTVAGFVTILLMELFSGDFDFGVVIAVTVTVAAISFAASYTSQSRLR